MKFSSIFPTVYVIETTNFCFVNLCLSVKPPAFSENFRDNFLGISGISEKLLGGTFIYYC